MAAEVLWRLFAGHSGSPSSSAGTADIRYTESEQEAFQRLAAVTAKAEAAVKMLMALAEAEAAGDCLEYLVGEMLM